MNDSGWDMFSQDDLLPEVLPESPLGLLRAWYDDAQSRVGGANPNAMTLATVDGAGRPAARVVLCKELETVRDGRVTFYTNFSSPKSVHLDANPYAAIVMHWDSLGRQIRLSGPVVRGTDAESDAYFASRPWEAKVGAWASRQSEPIESREALIARAMEAVLELGLDPLALEPDDRSVEVPRPPFWGGWRLWIERAELWISGPGRIHDRAEWRREVDISGGEVVVGEAWSWSRLQP